jgi:putative glutamine amidotransferase
VSRPTVAAVTYHLEPGRVPGWQVGAYAAPDHYVQALRRAGARVILVPAGQDEPAEALEGVGGLVLLGGGDVDPSRYGAGRHTMTYGVDDERDSFELALFGAAAERGLPTLAICRGMQVANVALGGTLHQHLPDLPQMGSHGLPQAAGYSLHEVKVAESSLLFDACQTPVLDCPSSHHQGIDRLGDGLAPVAWGLDGLIEAVEGREWWLLGVQWHPEATAATDPAQQSLFDAFTAAAGAHSSG